MQSEILHLKNVSKIFEVGENKVHAVNDVSFEIKKGEFVSVVGPSGSGKTTLLNLIGTIETPNHGTIIIDNEDVTKYSTKELSNFRRKKIGFIFQFFNLIDGLTAYENVELPLVFDNKELGERTHKVKQLFMDFNLEHLMDKFPEELSSGERQRIAIMRSLVNDPAIILADEPTGNLDTKTGASVINLLSELNKKRHTTILMVTHDLRAAKNAKRMISMLDGYIAKDELIN